MGTSRTPNKNPHSAHHNADNHADEAAGDTNNTAILDEVEVDSDDADADDDGASATITATETMKVAASNKSSSSSQQQQRRRRPPLQRSNSSSFNQSIRNLRQNLRRHSSQSFRALKRQSSTLIESLNDKILLPTSPTGWALLTLSAASIGLQYELHLQKELTAPPIVFCQDSKRSVLNERMDRIFDKLSSSSGSISSGSIEQQQQQQQLQSPPPSSSNRNSSVKEGIFSRKVTPSLFIGTRGIISSAAAYAMGDDASSSSNRQVKRVREVMKMGADGAFIVLDWEIPLLATVPSKNNAASPPRRMHKHRQQQPTVTNVTKANSIDKPVILLVHGMNNDSSFGYVRSMMRTATERGWIAVCMNLRGQDGQHKVKNNTPRGYNAGYTGDLRGVVQQIEYRLKKKKRGATTSTTTTNIEDDDNDYGGGGDGDDRYYVGGPIFLLGYSLGANIVTKYLGEESLFGTLPKCIGGGAAMGNPLLIHSGTISFPWNMLLGAGVKRSLLQNIQSFKAHHEPGFQHAMKKALLMPTIGTLDDTAAPYLIRNDPYPPFTPRVGGFKDGEEYWWDASSHRYVAHVSVPLLKISAQDDFLVFGQFAKKLNHCLENPNVVVVKTRCGGHLGWQESPPPSTKTSGSGKGGKLLGGSGSWSDVAVADFIEALLQVREEDYQKKMVEEGKVAVGSSPPSPKVLSRL